MPAEGAERRRKSSSITETAASGSAACQKGHMAHTSQNRDGVLRAAARHLAISPSPSRHRDSVKEGAAACRCLLEHGLLHPTQPRMSPKSCPGSIMMPCFCFKQVLVGAGVAAAAASKRSEFRPAGSHSPLLRACQWRWSATMTQHGASQLALRPAWCLNLVPPAALPLYLRFAPLGPTFGAQAP